MQQDVAFGFRQLVDVAEKALSPSLNDPTTAVQALDQIHDLLRRLALRPFPGRARRDEDGRLRLVMPTMSWEGYVSLGIDEIRRYGKDSLQVMRRLRAMLEDLQEVAPPDRAPIISKQMAVLRQLVASQFSEPHDRATASRGDDQGLGS